MIRFNRSKSWSRSGPVSGRGSRFATSCASATRASASPAALIASATVLTSLIGAFGWAFLQPPPQPLPGQGRCEAFLVDFTDEPTDLQIAGLNTIIDERIEKLPAGSCAVLARIPGDTGDGAPVEVVLETTKPRDGSDADWLRENARLMNKEFNETYTQPVDFATTTLVQPVTSKNSPLLEAIYALSKHAQLSIATEWRLSYFGDGLQHSDLISHLRGETDAKRLHGTVYEDDVNSYSRLSVAMYIVHSNKTNYRKRQGPSGKFWKAYFEPKVLSFVVTSL